jgi:hypothetical protein
MTNFDDGSLENRLTAESAGPHNIASWDQDGGLAEDISARGDFRKIVSLHVGTGLLSIRGAGPKGGDGNGE